MLQWYKNCYLGEGIRDAEKIRNKIEQGKLVHGIYLVTFSDNPDNLLEILPAVVLKQSPVRSLCPEIIGMAKGKEEAMAMVSEILSEVYEETGTFQVREYLKNR